jgi:hypothetical protein
MEVGDFVLEASCRLRRRNSVTLIPGTQSRKAAGIDSRLVALVAQGRLYYEELRRGEVQTLRGLAKRHGKDRADVGRALRLAFLAPDIVEAIASGHQPADLTVTRLNRLDDLPLSWSEQRRLLGFES